MRQIEIKSIFFQLVKFLATGPMSISVSRFARKHQASYLANQQHNNKLWRWLAYADPLQNRMTATAGPRANVYVIQISQIIEPDAENATVLFRTPLYDFLIYQFRYRWYPLEKTRPAREFRWTRLAGQTLQSEIALTP